MKRQKIKSSKVANVSLTRKAPAVLLGSDKAAYRKLREKLKTSNEESLKISNLETENAELKSKLDKIFTQLGIEDDG